MIRLYSLSGILLLSFFALAPITKARAEVEVGKTAPNFTLMDLNGASRSLGEFKGKPVVLEWFNRGCPFVKKHYVTGNMQKLQKAYADKGVVWLSIVSSAAGKQGNATPAEHRTLLGEWGAGPTAFLIDESGAVGKLYGAKTTPTAFIIDKEGTLIYQGGIDNSPTPKEEDVASATNCVVAALEELLAGKKVTTPTTGAYGCAVKYES